MLPLESVLFIHDTRNGRSLITARIQLENMPLDFLQTSIQINYIVSHQEELGYRIPLLRRLEDKLVDLIEKLEKGDDED